MDKETQLLRRRVCIKMLDCGDIVEWSGSRELIRRLEAYAPMLSTTGELIERLPRTGIRLKLSEHVILHELQAAMSSQETLSGNSSAEVRRQLEGLQYIAEIDLGQHDKTLIVVGQGPRHLARAIKALQPFTLFRIEAGDAQG